MPHDFAHPSKPSESPPTRLEILRGQIDLATREKLLKQQQKEVYKLLKVKTTDNPHRKTYSNP
jgi:hypothetical protein